MLSIVLVCLFAAALAGGSGYCLSSRFWKTQYSRTDTSGDFGTPRGGFIVTLSGAMIGMFFFAYLGKYLFPAETLGPALITSMITGAIGGMAALFQGVKNRNTPSDEPKDDAKNEPKDEPKDETPKKDDDSK